MMLNIFSIFDPSSSMNFSFNWLSILLILTLLPFQFWIIPSRLFYFWYSILMYMFNEFKILTKYSYSNITLFISLFLLIMFNNFMGLFPYIFTSSSHMSFSMSLSMSFWLSMMIYGLYKYLNDMLSHLTPQSTPLMLMPFMVLIETISLIIRPFTLAIRLTANMIAGHLLLSLLGSKGSTNNSLIAFFMIIMSQIILYILEIAVAMIQAYVFSILSTLYSSEI